MMNWQTLPIALCYLGLSGLVIWFVLQVKAHWLLRLALALAVPAATFMVWRSVGSYQGYPTSEALPSKALVLWGEVREPNPRSGDPGAIYLWLLPLERHPSGMLSYDPRRSEPRAYVLSYKRSRHQRVEAARGRIREGRPVLLDQSGPEGEITGEMQGGAGTDQAEEEDSLHLYDFPAPQLPRKDGP